MSDLDEMPDLEEIPTEDYGAPPSSDTKAEALQLSVRLELTPISAKYKLLMAKKARRDNKKEKNVRQVMKAEEVAGYRGNEDTDAILMSLGELFPWDVKKRQKKGSKIIFNNEMEDLTTPLKDEVLKDDFSKSMDQMGQFKARLHAVPTNIPIQIFAGPEYESVNPEQLKKIEIEIRSSTIPEEKYSTVVINREIQTPDYFQISRKRGRQGNTRKKVSRKFQKLQKYRRQTEQFMSRPYTEEENGSAPDYDEDESLEDENNNLQTSGSKRPGIRGNSPGSGRRMQPESMGRADGSPCSCADKDDQSRLDQLQIELQETTNHLQEVGEELSLERKTNDQLRAKLLNNDFSKNNEILGQRQKDNQNIISHIRESPGLKLIPQVQDALIILDEFSARLVLASDELNSQYENMVWQSQSNKDRNNNELQTQFDLSCLEGLEPPNLGANLLNFLQSFTIMGQSSSHPTTAPLPPLAFTTYPPPLLYRPPTSIHSDEGPTSPMVNLKSATMCPEEDVAPTSPKPPLDAAQSTMPNVRPTSPKPPLDVAQSTMPNNSTSHNATGTRSKVFKTAASTVPIPKTGKRYDNLIAQLKGYHPNLILADAHSYLMELRKSNNGKLSGMSIQDIMEKVASFIERDRGMSCGASAGDENCSICFDDMSPTDSICLSPCNHRFHNNCINIWLESPGGAGSTCPMCRNYIIKEDEFPGLGSS